MVRFLVQLEISLALNFSLTLLLWSATFNAQLLDGLSGNAAQTFMSRINAATFLACYLEPSWGQSWNLLHALLSCCSCILCSNVQTQTMAILLNTESGNTWLFHVSLRAASHGFGKWLKTFSVSKILICPTSCESPAEHVCCGVCLQSELCGVLPHIPGDTVDLRRFLQWGGRRCSGIGVHNRQTNIFHRLHEVQQEKVIYSIANCVMFLTEMTLCKVRILTVCSGFTGCMVFTWPWSCLPLCLYWVWLDSCVECSTSTLTSTSEDFTSSSSFTITNKAF